MGAGPRNAASSSMSSMSASLTSRGFRLISIVVVVLTASAPVMVDKARAAKVVPPIRLAVVAQVEMPVAIAFRRDDPTLYVAEQTGRVKAVLYGKVGEAPVLDLSAEVSVTYEQGLLGLTFSPAGDFLYVGYTDLSGDSYIVEFAFRGGEAILSTRRELLFVAQPSPVHNNGHLAFGPDGMLYIGLGDGGWQGDEFDNGQSLATLLGSILRVDPRASEALPYTVPSDNPFVGLPGARPEIWVHGLRQPWRFSFDRSTGDLWLGDVGENTVEEVDFRPRMDAAGSNFGWDAYEGTRLNRPLGPPEHVLPLHEYGRGTNYCAAVTGGYLYRGARIPSISGAYVFGDFCSGQVFGLRQLDGKLLDVRALGLKVPYLSSFGEDPDGELYVASLYGPVYRLEAP